MEVSVADAKAQLTELVRLAEAGEHVVLTRHGRPAVTLVPVERIVSPPERRALLEELRRVASAKAKPGMSAARSQDDLYREDGLPR
ncbi:type II toxin-antitoxin system Phd/YefM family antitoxin [Aureimonas pseudogalii]|uniref:Antitoxin n=1 Tax=Aureimonas pseudogalii TaxID=1744844 RepID=A0A7W6H794_9HYPH|nr:type II toxin-antitoxin system prevent-host-death family antitoxin [Aureimonas pseudogalii]MBB3999743.1 prevent-host-death family protein [Aureimonas pseudogalii]